MLGASFRHLVKRDAMETNSTGSHSEPNSEMTLTEFIEQKLPKDAICTGEICYFERCHERQPQSAHNKRRIAQARNQRGFWVRTRIDGPCKYRIEERELASAGN